MFSAFKTNKKSGYSPYSDQATPLISQGTPVLGVTAESFLKSIKEPPPEKTSQPETTPETHTESKTQKTGTKGKKRKKTSKDLEKKNLKKAKFQIADVL